MVEKRFDIESRFKTLRDTKRNTPTIQNPPEDDTIGEIAVKGGTGTLAFGNILYNMQDPISNYQYTMGMGTDEASFIVEPWISYTNCYIEIPRNDDSRDSGDSGDSGDFADAAYQNLLTAVGASASIGQQYINTYTESSLETSEIFYPNSDIYVLVPPQIPQPWSFYNPVAKPTSQTPSPVKIGLQISNSVGNTANTSSTSLDGNEFIFHLTVIEKYLTEDPPAPPATYCGDFTQDQYLYYFVCDAVQVNGKFYDFLCGLPCQVNNYCVQGPPQNGCGPETIYTNGITITPQFKEFQYCFTIYSVVLSNTNLPFIAIYQNIIPFENVTQSGDYVLNGYVLTGYVPSDYNASCTNNAQPVSSNAAYNQSICEFAGQSVPRTYVTDFSQYTNLDFAYPVLFYVDNIYLVTLLPSSIGQGKIPTKFTIEGKTYDFELVDEIKSKIVYPDIIYHIAGWQLSITTPLKMIDRAAVNITYIQS